MAGIHDDGNDSDLPPLLQAAKDGDPAAFKKLLLDEEADVLVKDKVRDISHIIREREMKTDNIKI